MVHLDAFNVSVILSSNVVLPEYHTIFSNSNGSALIEAVPSEFKIHIKPTRSFPRDVAVVVHCDGKKMGLFGFRKNAPKSWTIEGKEGRGNVVAPFRFVRGSQAAGE